ncbi:N2227-domain-containing protein [Rhizodiscina lignyota]|uniref:carnosine N-methyltransferase n=1 Tax=Rhizodiscina lignyota TaxID=1504668 RepID=A0A9P4IRQ5_9PEZI|nr:N2227-domain-containing protein [Rhizodiscina lignyota]
MPEATDAALQHTASIEDASAPSGNDQALNDAEEEQRVLLAAIDSFQSYRTAAHYNVTHLRRQSFYALPQAHWTLLAEPPFSILDTFNEVDDAIDANADIAEAIANAALPPFGIALEEDGEASHEGNSNNNEVPWRGQATPSDRDKARSTLRQIYRDWSAEGAAERDACYGPILQALQSEFSSTPDREKGNISVLVPGAGLGRLVFEVCRAGFAAEGNEISFHQLLTSSYILNHSSRADQFALYPFALSFSNHVSRSNQLRKVLIPDVHPATALEEASAGMDIHAFERLGMAAADFCVAYKEPHSKDKYDAIATAFFIDTAPNLIAYIEAIQNCLKSGGIWVNVGPLLWHFENNPPGKPEQGSRQPSASDPRDATFGNQSLGIGEAGSVELSEEEVVHLVQHFGFTMEKHEWGVHSTGYIQDPRSMLQNVYKPSFWIARKR